MANIEAKSKTTQNGTVVLKASIRNGEYLGKLQTSGPNIETARNRMESVLQFLGAKVDLTVS